MTSLETFESRPKFYHEDYGIHGQKILRIRFEVLGVK